MLIQDHKAVLQGQQKKETGRLHGREWPGLGVHWHLIIYLLLQLCLNVLS